MSCTPTEKEAWGQLGDVIRAPMKAEIESLRGSVAKLREALHALDEMIFNDPQVIERASEMRAIISEALTKCA